MRSTSSISVQVNNSKWSHQGQAGGKPLHPKGREGMAVVSPRAETGGMRCVRKSSM